MSLDLKNYLLNTGLSDPFSKKVYFQIEIKIDGNLSLIKSVEMELKNAISHIKSNNLTILSNVICYNSKNHDTKKLNFDSDEPLKKMKEEYDIMSRSDSKTFLIKFFVKKNS